MLRCLLTASEWTCTVSQLRRSGTMFFLAFSAGGGDPDGPGPGGVGEPACGGKGGGREEEEEEEQEHSSPAPVCACGLEKRSRTRLAPKRGSIGQETGHVCASQSPCRSNRQWQVWGFPHLELFTHRGHRRLAHRGLGSRCDRCPQAVATETCAPWSRRRRAQGDLIRLRGSFP